MEMIYCDNAATTQTAPEVIALMAEASAEFYGNPSSLHTYGQKAKNKLEEAREELAQYLNCKASEVFFTGGGTDGNNIAINGLTKSQNQQKEIITSSIEHSAVLKPLEELEKNGWRIVKLPVNQEGIIKLSELESKLSNKTTFVSIMLANNEIGSIQDIKQAVSLCKKLNIPFHTDAVQAFGKIPVNVDELGVDLLTISAHKFYGPKGVGALFCKDGLHLGPLTFGGGQEKLLKPGTENLPAILGMVKAAELAYKNLEQNTQKLQNLQNKLIKGLSELDKISINSSIQNKNCIPGLVNFSIKDVKGDAAILRLSLSNIAISSGSACSSGSIQPSPVISALYPADQNPKEQWRATNSVRVSFGKNNKEEDVELILQAIKKLIN